MLDEDLREGMRLLRGVFPPQEHVLILSPHHPRWAVAWWQRHGVKTVMPNGELWPEQPDEMYAEALRLLREDLADAR